MVFQKKHDRNFLMLGKEVVIKILQWAEGIQGFIYSIKNKRTFFFRSLLELKFFIDLENNEKVINYSVEPFQIKLENNHHYTPDVLINNEFFS